MKSCWCCLNFVLPTMNVMLNQRATACFICSVKKNKKEVNIINSSNDNKNKNGVSLTLIFKIVRMVLFVTDYNC